MVGEYETRSTISSSCSIVQEEWVLFKYKNMRSTHSHSLSHTHAHTDNIAHATFIPKSSMLHICTRSKRESTSLKIVIYEPELCSWRGRLTWANFIKTTISRPQIVSLTVFSENLIIFHSNLIQKSTEIIEMFGSILNEKFCHRFAEKNSEQVD